MRGEAAPESAGPETTIAGLDLSQNGRVIIAIFAWAGATQIAFGIATLIVSLRYRSLVPLMLALAILERTLHALNARVIKGAGAGHHPPTMSGSQSGSGPVWSSDAGALPSHLRLRLNIGVRFFADDFAWNHRRCAT